MSAEHRIEDTNESYRGCKVWLPLQSTHDKRHNPDPQDLSLLGMVAENTSMIRNDGLDELQTECLRKS